MSITEIIPIVNPELLPVATGVVNGTFVGFAGAVGPTVAIGGVVGSIVGGVVTVGCCAIRVGEGVVGAIGVGVKVGVVVGWVEVGAGVGVGVFVGVAVGAIVAEGVAVWATCVPDAKTEKLALKDLIIPKLSRVWIVILWAPGERPSAGLNVQIPRPSLVTVAVRGVDSIVILTTWFGSAEP